MKKIFKAWWQRKKILTFLVNLKCCALSHFFQLLNRGMMAKVNKYVFYLKTVVWKKYAVVVPEVKEICFEILTRICIYEK